MKNLLLCLAVAGLVLITSCGKDDGPAPLPPVPAITFPDGNTVNVERGASVDVAINLSADGGIRSLTANGEDFTFTTGDDNTTGTATYTFQAAADEAFGDQTVTFAITDERDQVENATLTITVVGSTIEVSDHITADVTWESENIYILTDSIIVKGATLTIEAGTTIYGRENNPELPNGDDNKFATGLQINDDAALIAEGTADAPIVFTSENVLDGTAEAGDWEGLKFSGNRMSDQGSVRYVRIEYGGGSVDGGDASAFRLNEVTKETDFEYIQVFNPLQRGIRADDSAHVNIRYLIVTNANNHASIAVRGKAQIYGQYVIGNGPNAEHIQRMVRVDQDDSKIFMANFTLLGSGEPGGGSLDGMRIHNSPNTYQFYSGIVAEFPDDGIRAQGYSVGSDSIANTYVFKIGGTGETDGIPDGMGGFSSALRDGAVNFVDLYGNQWSQSTTLVAGIGIDDFVPDAAVAPTFTVDLTAINSFFENSGFVGAVGSTDWTLGWSLNTDGSAR